MAIACVLNSGPAGGSASPNLTAVAPLLEDTPDLFGGSAVQRFTSFSAGSAIVSSAAYGLHSFSGAGSTDLLATCGVEIIAADAIGGSPYATWASGPFASTLTNTTASLDFDNGGLDTGIEWIVGGDPTNNNDDAGRTPTFNNSDPNNFVFSYLRRDAANSDANTTIAVQYATNLTGWSTATNGVNGVTINDASVPSPGFHTVLVTIPKALAGPGGRLFARLSVLVAP